MSDDGSKINQSLSENQDNGSSNREVNPSNVTDLTDTGDLNPRLINGSTENIESQFINLSFKKAFWLIFAAIAAIQIFQFSFIIYFGFDLEKYPPEYYLWDEIGGIIWYVILLMVVIYDLRIQNVSPVKVFNFNFSITKERLPQILKYFSGCALFVIALSFLVKETELQLENQTSLTIYLMFLTTVIIAPVFEEMVFRGYLYTAMFSSFKRKKERMVVNAMLFACAHVFLIEFLLGGTIPYYIFVLGYLLAKLYEESRSVTPGILLHSLNNALVFGIDLIKIN